MNYIARGYVSLSEEHHRRENVRASFPFRERAIFSTLSLFLSLLFFGFFLSSPVFFLFSSCSSRVLMFTRGVRRANHSCQWSLPRARSLRSRILHVGMALVGPAIIIEHLSDPVSLLLVLLLFFADFLLIFLGRSSMRKTASSQIVNGVAARRPKAGDFSCFLRPFRLATWWPPTTNNFG